MGVSFLSLWKDAGVCFVDHKESVYCCIAILDCMLNSLYSFQVLLIDGRGHLLGRLSAIVAKQVLLGKFLLGLLIIWVCYKLAYLGCICCTVPLDQLDHTRIEIRFQLPITLNIRLKCTTKLLNPWL